MWCRLIWIITIILVTVTKRGFFFGQKHRSRSRKYGEKMIRNNRINNNYMKIETKSNKMPLNNPTEQLVNDSS